MRPRILQTAGSVAMSFSSDTKIDTLGMRNGTATSEDGLAVADQAEHTRTPGAGHCRHGYLSTQRRWNRHPHENLHVDVYSSFSHHCRNLGAAGTPFPHR